MYITNKNSEEIKVVSKRRKALEISFFQKIKALFRPKAAFELRLKELLAESDVYGLVMLGDIDGVKEYLDDGFDINTKAPDKLGNTIAHLATAFGEHEILQLCLDRGYDVNIKNNNGETISTIKKFEKNRG